VDGMTLGDAGRSGLNEYPLKWARAHAQSSEAGDKICAKYGFSDA